MRESVAQALQEFSSHPLGLVFALILGFASAAASACCTLPAMALLVGYGAARRESETRAVLKSALFFTLGTILSLTLIGAFAGFAGQVAQCALGRYWKAFAGVAAVFLGLGAVRLLPFRLSFGSLGGTDRKSGRFGAALAGLAIGGIVAVCSLPCNPGIFIVIGAAILQGRVLWAMLMMAMFAIGFSLPLGAVLLGVSLGKVSLAAKGADAAIRWIAGPLLVLTGFYFLVTF